MTENRGVGSSILPLAIAFIVATGILVSAPTADGFVYWGKSAPDGKIGRADTGGTNPDPNFIDIPDDPGAGSPCGIAVNGTHLYFANQDNSSIGRANLNGSGLDPSLIPIPGDVAPCGVAVNGTHVFWANLGDDAIGRANLDGTDVVQSFIGGIDNPCGVAVDGSFVYWGHEGGTSPTTIGRANLDGTGADESFIEGVDSPCGVAVNATHIFWGNRDFTPGAPTNAIGRAEIDDPATADQDFIPLAGFPNGVALNSTHLFWANDAGPTPDVESVGRAALDGDPGSVDPAFIPAAAPLAVAVDDFPHPSATSVSCSPATVGPTEATSCTATVSDVAAANRAAPGGRVDFSANTGGGSFGSGGACDLTPINSSQSSCAVSFVPGSAGATDVTGSYTSDGRHGASSGSGTVEVEAPTPSTPSTRSTTTGLSCAPVAVEVTQPATCVATVTDTVPGALSTPAGTVAFSSSGGSFGAGVCDLIPVNEAQSTCSTSFVPGQIGTASIGAAYGGSAVHAPSSGAAEVAASILGLGKPTKNKAKGTAELPVEVPGPGTVELSGKGLKDADEVTEAAGTVELKVKADGKKKRRLKEKGKATVEPKVTFTPSGGGEQSSETTEFKLKQR